MVPVSSVEGYVGGEHGSAAYPLWSTVSIAGTALGDYLAETGKSLDREEVVGYVRGVSKKLVDVIGGTEVGPAAGFRDIVRSILQDRGEVYSVAQPLKLQGISETVNVNVPTRVGMELGPNIWDSLPPEEQANVVEAAKAIHANYLTGLRAVGKA